MMVSDVDGWDLPPAVRREGSTCPCRRARARRGTARIAETHEVGPGSPVGSYSGRRRASGAAPGVFR